MANISRQMQSTDFILEQNVRKDSEYKHNTIIKKKHNIVLKLLKVQNILILNQPFEIKYLIN